MKNNKLIIGLLITLLSISNNGFAVEYKIGAGVVNGYYKYLSEYICSYIKSKDKNQCIVVESTGAIDNINNNLQKNNNIFFTQEDVANDSLKAIGNFYGKSPNTKIRKIIKLYPETLNIVVSAKYNSKIKSIAELKGSYMRFVGARSNSIFTTRVLYTPNQWDSKDWEKVSYSSSFSDSIKLLCNNSLDAVIYVGGHVNMQLKDVITSCNLKFLDTSTIFLDGNNDYPYYFTSIIPAQSYSSKLKNVKAVAVSSILATSADLPDDMVYAFLTDLFEAFELLKIDNSNIVIDLSYDISKDIKENKIKYHNGAIKFFKDKGMLK